MNDRRFDELVEKYGGGSLDSHETEELLRMLETDAALLDEFRRLHRVNNLLHELRPEKLDIDRLMLALPDRDENIVANRVIERAKRGNLRPGRIRPSHSLYSSQPARTRLKYWLPLAAGVCILLASPFIVKNYRAAQDRQMLGAVVVSVEGEFSVIHDNTASAIAVGSVLAPGDRVKTGPNAKIEFQYRDGTTMSLGQNSEVRLDACRRAKRLETLFGKLEGRVAKQFAGRPLIFVTPHAVATVIGTQVRLDVSISSTRLDVQSGRVQIAQKESGESVIVEAGQYAVAMKGAKLVALPIEPPIPEPAIWVSPYKQWKNGPPKDDTYFPIGVWMQQPNMAARYKDLGINHYVALWEGPTEEQLAGLRKAGMPVICDQNAVGLKHKDDPIIIGWILFDEPDNAQSLGKDKGYGPPISTGEMIRRYGVLKANDPTRPVYLNFGQGVAWDDWYGRGVRTRHPEDYVEYVKACDISSFDIYPVVHERPEVSGKLWYVANGVERLRRWTPAGKPVWNVIECTRINSTRKPTPSQVRTEVWMSLIHGSMGITYFVHEWKPRFNEHALLDDREMADAVKAINLRIHALAPVLNSPNIANSLHVSSSKQDVPVAAIMKRYDGSIYVFAVAMRDSSTTATFTIDGLAGEASAEVLDEQRTVSGIRGTFSDTFKPYEIHLYKIAGGGSRAAAIAVGDPK